MDALLEGAGANAAAEPARRVRIAAVFMVMFFLFDHKEENQEGERGCCMLSIIRSRLLACYIVLVDARASKVAAPTTSQEARRTYPNLEVVCREGRKFSHRA